MFRIVSQQIFPHTLQITINMQYACIAPSANKTYIARCHPTSPVCLSFFGNYKYYFFNGYLKIDWIEIKYWELTSTCLSIHRKIKNKGTWLQIHVPYSFNLALYSTPLSSCDAIPFPNRINMLMCSLHRNDVLKRCGDV